MMRAAEQKARALQLHETACKTIPGRTVIVASDADGFGKINVVTIPGIVLGDGGTADILAAALRELGGYQVTKVPVEIQGLDAGAQAMYFRVVTKLGLDTP